MNNDTTIHHAGAKFAAAFGVFATIEWWTNVGKVCGALLSLALLTEWVWKKLIKPLAIKRGWRKGKPRDFLESTGKGDL